MKVENKCPQCGRELASKESVARHLEKYCRYRQGKKAKQPVVARRRVAVDVDDGGEFWGDECLAIRTSCLLYTSPSPRDLSTSRMPSSA